MVVDSHMTSILARTAMSRSRLSFTTLLIIVAPLLATARADEPAAPRTAERIAAELAAAPLPRVDVAAMADPGYAAEFTRRRDDIRQKRAALILQLHDADAAAV